MSAGEEQHLPSREQMPALRNGLPMPYTPACVLQPGFSLPTSDFLLEWKWSSFRSTRRPCAAAGRLRAWFLSISSLGSYSSHFPPCGGCLEGQPGGTGWIRELLSRMELLGKGVLWKPGRPCRDKASDSRRWRVVALHRWLQRCGDVY